MTESRLLSMSHLQLPQVITQQASNLIQDVQSLFSCEGSMQQL